MVKDIKKVGLNEKNYPKTLKELNDAPQTLYYLGELPKENEFSVSIVGTRKATSEGRLIAKRLAKELAENGFTVISGLAFGIDAAAHEGALLGGGKTFAVLGTDLQRISPRQNENLGIKIINSGGGIISEYPLGTKVMPYMFLERNRIVSGLSVATIVIEAPEGSGAIVTAKHALEQGREVFVFPGPADHPNYKYSHKLIREGARLVTSIEDILEDLEATTPTLPEFRKENDNSKKTKALQSISNAEQLNIFNAFSKTKENLTVDNISEITKLEPYIVNRELTFLIMKDLVEERNGKFAVRIRTNE